MKQHEFTLVLTDDPDENDADRLYGIFGDGTISTVVGVPQVHFHRKAGSLEEAIRSALADYELSGLPCRPCGDGAGRRATFVRFFVRLLS